MIYYEASPEDNIKYRDRFPEVNKKELNWICNGTFKDSPYVIYRDVYYKDGKPVGFIDVYSFDENDANIVLAVLSQYRGEGIASAMIKKMERQFNKSSMKYLAWKTDVDNTDSQKLAQKLGYKLSEKRAKTYIFRKPNPKYKE